MKIAARWLAFWATRQEKRHRITAPFRSPASDCRWRFTLWPFELILAAAKDKGLLKGKTIGVDATDLEANASMKSIVRKDNGDDWREYLRKLYEEETGISDPDDEELRRFDKRRKPKKKVSNEDWESATDPDSRIGKMKDGRFHLKYKAENAVDLETEMIVAAEVYHGNVGDTSTIEDTVNTARTHLREAGTECEVKEVVADKGYHGEETLGCDSKRIARFGLTSRRRTEKRHRTWTDKSPRREVVLPAQSPEHAWPTWSTTATSTQ